MRLDWDIDPRCELSSPAVATLISQLAIDFDEALANHMNLDGLLTPGALAWYLVDGLVEGLGQLELDQQDRALMLRELGDCLAYLGAKYTGGLH